VKAFLLAAGEGRRLRPLTESLPKCLVPIRGIPLLAIWLQLLETHEVTSVLVNVHHFRERVTAFLGSHPTSVAVETVHEPRLLGSAGTVLANRGFVEGEKSFLVLYADNLTAVDLRKMVAFHRGRPEPLTVGVAPTDRPSEKGTVRLGSQGQVIEFAEKAAQPPSNLANTGIYVANQELFEYLPRSLPAAGVLDFGYDVLPRMVPHVAAYTIDEFLMDIGTPDAYERAQQIWPGLPASASIVTSAPGE
jgi:mannose-1-phosphate guanylyltransferase